MFERDFVAYEYKTVSVKAKDQAKTMDVYEAFGWEVTSAAQTLDGHAVLSLKRDRKQRHRQRKKHGKRRFPGKVRRLQVCLLLNRSYLRL